MNVRRANGRKSKRQRTAALQNLAEEGARNLSRQSRACGRVRLSSAAFVAGVRSLTSAATDSFA
jgi:hypothetical protein